MPWNLKDYPESFKNFDHVVRKKAIDIGNSLLDDGYDEDEAIPIATEQAKEWAGNASSDELKSYKYGDRPEKDDDHESQADPELLDSDVLVYFDEESSEWLVRSDDADQASDRFDNKSDAVDRAKEIAENKGTKVVRYTREGERQD